MKIKMAKEAETSECFKMSERKHFIYKNMTEVSSNYKNSCLFSYVTETAKQPCLKVLEQTVFLSPFKS